MDVVPVGAAVGIEAGVGVIPDPDDVAEHDVFRQNGIYFVDYVRGAFRQTAAVRVEMGCEVRGMDTRIRPSGPHHSDFLPQSGRHCLLDLILDAGSIVLNLPSGEPRAVVRY